MAATVLNLKILKSIFIVLMCKRLNNYFYIIVKCHVLLDSRWRPFSPYLADSSEQLCVRERERERERERKRNYQK